MEDHLKYTLSLTNEWLKFAETKNGALFAANLGMVFGIATLLRSTEGISQVVSYYLLFSLTFLLFSAACCLLSFTPQIHIPGLTPTRRCEPTDNLLFYGHIACYDPIIFLTSLHSKVATPTVLSADNAIDFYIAEQIVINSRIAVWKYHWFRIALWATLSVFVTPVLSVTFILLRKRA